MTTFINIRSTKYKFHPQEIRAAVQKLGMAIRQIFEDKKKGS